MRKVTGRDPFNQILSGSWSLNSLDSRIGNNGYLIMILCEAVCVRSNAHLTSVMFHARVVGDPLGPEAQAEDVAGV